jgi:hypothetical protein
MVKEKSLFGGDGHLNEEGVSLYVDALKLERTAELPRETRLHVANCQRCRKEITGLFALLTDADYEGAVPHPYFEKGGEQGRWTPRELLRVAAAVTAVIGAALVLYYLSLQPEEDESATVQYVERVVRGDSATAVDTTGSGAASGGGQLFAEHFVELAELEDLVNAELRATSIQSVSPGIGAVVEDPIVFRWTPDIQGPVYVEILNNREEIVHSGDVVSLPYIVRRPEAPGLYYWKLIGDDELVLVGKFLVKE